MNELRGMPVVKAMKEQLSQAVETLKQTGVLPKLAVVRVGARGDDLSYERGIFKRFENVGASVEVTALPEDVSQEALEAAVTALDRDESIHGILLFRPLPRHLSEASVKQCVSLEKDVDCMRDENLARVFLGECPYPPCTPQAVMELLHHYGVDLSGKSVTIVGRSLVVGKPLSMLMLKENATVTICHTRTKDLKTECLRADIVVACAGAANLLNRTFFHNGQVIVDVGIHSTNEGLCGDVCLSECDGLDICATPVPGGVGTVTTSVLLKHVVAQAKRTAEEARRGQ